jgi:hypothetical protein
MSLHPVASIAANKAVAQSSATSATQTQPAVQSSPAAKESTASKPKATTDTVSISSAGNAALQEAKETAVQTASEARSGDHQAQRALARTAALGVGRK